MNTDIERFHDWSARYENSWIQRYLDPLHDLMLESTAAEARELSPDSILDVGCGTGRLLRKAEKRWPGSQLLGVDPALGMIEVARKLTPNARFYQAPAESIPIADRSIDLVLSAVSMHHWSSALLGIHEASRVLRQGGLVCIADIALPSWLSKLFHSKAQTRVAIRELLNGANLSIKQQQTTNAGGVLVCIARKELQLP
jgi:ubiquinone/menaquinone biosynthesis C-methylase UbiE